MFHSNLDTFYSFFHVLTLLFHVFPVPMFHSNLDTFYSFFHGSLLFHYNPDTRLTPTKSCFTPFDQSPLLRTNVSKVEKNIQMSKVEKSMQYRHDEHLVHQKSKNVSKCIKSRKTYTKSSIDDKMNKSVKRRKSDQMYQKSKKLSKLSR
jgi:hypothetical protein